MEYAITDTTGETVNADTSQVVCVGTAWAEGRASEQIAREPPAPGTDLQFSRRGLDSSLLQNLHVILTGITYTEIATAVRDGQPVDAGVRRIGGAQLAPYHVAHFYECSAELCKRIAALTPERIKDLADNWHALLGHPNTQSSPVLREWRLETIENLAALARVSDDRNTRLLLRAEYRGQE
jgi:hypothetical protein